MTAPFRHVDTADLMGSWPVLPHYSGSTPAVLPRSLLSRATILSSRQESTVGFDLNTRSFNIQVDANAPFSVSFTGVANLTLDEVITQINVASVASPVGTNIAFRDNGFLRLESPTAGEDSYLKIEINTPGASHEALYEVGLFSGAESFGGDIAPTNTIDFRRQTAQHGQLSMAIGEDLTAEVINRMALQLSVNTDRASGLFDRRRLAEKTETNQPISAGGFTLSADVFTGDSLANLPNNFAILDSNYNEVVQENHVDLDVGLNANLYYDSETGKQHVVAGSSVFIASDDKGEIYFTCSDASMGVLQDVPLKILEYISGTEVVVLNVDPTDGNRIDIGTPGSAQAVTGGKRIRIDSDILLVTDVLDAPAGSSVVGVPQIISSSATIDRVEHNNRLYCSAATFVSDGVVPGAVAVIANHSSVNPFTNNGTYKVKEVLDEKTVSLMSEDWGPVILNPTTSGIMGDVEIQSDGLFFHNPYVELSFTPTAGTYKVLYKKESTLRDILTQPDVFGGPIRFDQEAEAQTQKVLKAIIGPSVTSFNEYLYGDSSYSLETLSYRIGTEHDEAGSHTEIHADDIYASDIYGGNLQAQGNVLVDNLIGDTSVSIRSHRVGANYYNALLDFDTPRSDTPDGSSTGNRAYIIAVGQNTHTHSSLMIGANSANAVLTGDEAAIRANQMVLEISSLDRALRVWREGVEQIRFDTDGASWINNTLAINKGSAAAYTFEVAGDIATSAGSIYLDRVGDATDANFIIRSDNQYYSTIAFYTGVLLRWQINSGNVDESGGNAGSPFEIRRFNDAGSLLGTPLTINRATGIWTHEQANHTWGGGRFRLEPSSDSSTSGTPAIRFNLNDATYNTVFSYDRSSWDFKWIINNATRMILDGGTVSASLWIDDELRLTENNTTNNEGMIFSRTYSAGNSSSRIFFCENTNKLYGFSIIDAGSANPTLGGQPFTLPDNTFNVIRHNGNAAGNAALTLERSTGHFGINRTNPVCRFHLYEDATLGSTAGDYNLVSRLEAESSNQFLRNQYIVRDAAGSGWDTARWNDSIGVDSTWITPSTGRCFWERDPASGQQFWGDNGVTHMDLSASRLYVDGYLEVNNGNIVSGNTTGFLNLSAGTAGNGANIELYGGSHASYANDIYIDANTHNFRNQAGSTQYGYWDSGGLYITTGGFHLQNGIYLGEGSARSTSNGGPDGQCIIRTFAATTTTYPTVIFENSDWQVIKAAAGGLRITSKTSANLTYRLRYDNAHANGLSNSAGTTFNYTFIYGFDLHLTNSYSTTSNVMIHCSKYSTDYYWNGYIISDYTD